MKRMACVLALATGTGLAFGAATTDALADPSPARAAKGLQVDITTSGIISSEGTVNLDVRFRGGNLREVELYVDGALVKKQSVQTRSGRGTISFAVDSLLLADGAHSILIKALDLDGNTASATSRINVLPVDLNAPLRFASPKSRAMVQGVVPIEVKLDASIRKPYVMFFINNDFLALINYPPYTYNWDSARHPNGLATLGVKAFDGETLAEVQGKDIRVVVNNPGGLTHRQSETPDLRNPAGTGVPKPIAAPKLEASLTRSPAETAVPGSPMEVQAASGKLAPITVSPQMAMNLRSSAKPSGASSRKVAIASPDSGARPMAPNAGLNRVARPGLMAMLATPKDLTSLVLSPVAPGLTPHPVRPLRAGNVASRPSMRLSAAPIASPNAHAKPAPARPRAVKAQVGSGSLFQMRGGTFDVAFDNARIAFDVQPRVEKGLPLAPFRQIFEHTGGTVSWFGQSKLLRAVNATREIEIKVGSPEAKVNNQPLTLEAIPYLDRGRTIVPLSFIRDALDVSIQYDARTGRMVIESRK